MTWPGPSLCRLSLAWALASDTLVSEGCSNMYSALPYITSPLFSSIKAQPTYFNSLVLVERCKMGPREWIWKNKSDWKPSEIYKIDFIYWRFSNSFNSTWKKMKKKIGEYSLTCEGNEYEWKCFDQMEYWITVVIRTGAKWEILCFNPLCASWMAHLEVFKKPSSQFFDFYSFIFILFTFPAVSTHSFRFFQALLKIFENLK